MSVRRAAAMMLAWALVVGSIGCSRGLFRQYEYEEEIYLKLDGSAEVVVNTSIAALVALRGVDLPTDPTASIDRDRLRAIYGSGGVSVLRVSRPWRRDGRRFVQVRIRTDNVRTLAAVAPFAWSTYRFDLQNGVYVFRQVLGASVARPVGNVGWDGAEIVAVRLHIPSKIQYHNAPSREVERGNILGWEQSLTDRLAGKPLDVEVRMETASILARTLIIFGLSAVAALTLLAAVIFWIRRAGRPPAAR